MHITREWDNSVSFSNNEEKNDFSFLGLLPKNGAKGQTVRKSFFETKTIYQNKNTL
jgi:hypothetical protein